MDSESPRLRLSILGIVVFSLFAALFARLYYLQIMDTEQGEVEAAANRVRTIQEEAPRGRILDAKGRILVDNRTSLVVTIDQNALKDLKKDQRDSVILRVAEQLTKSGIPTKVAAIERRLADPQYSPLEPVPVAIDVPEDLQVFLAERADEFPGVQVRRESVRKYPEGSLAAHVVGYVGRISQEELTDKMGTKEDPKPVAKPYAPDSDVGKTGVEATFEDDLRGTPGIRHVEVDAKGKIVRDIPEAYQRPVPGNDVQLTIDIDVQRVTETKLADQLESARGGYNRDGTVARAPAGSAVVLDPRNGHVVALASYPTYDPTEFVNGISSDRYDQLRDSPDHPLTNRTIQGLYAPGSTFKLVTATAALSKGMITGSSSFNDTGSFQVGNRTFHNAESAVNGYVNLPRAITVSSDVYFYWLGARFWNERAQVGDGIQETAKAYGFGAATGVQLPSELAGMIPDPALKQQRHDANPTAFPEGKWYPGDNVNLAIGQGDVLVTPLQLANAYATFASQGVLHRPTIVLRVLKPGADAGDPALDTCDVTAPTCAVVRRIDPVEAGHVDLPSNVYDPIHQGLGGVTTDRGGTATHTFEGFDQRTWPIEAKTGTAQVNGKADNSLFVAFGPANDPQYVAAAVLEESGFGADAAGPVVRGIFEQVSGQAQAEVDAACGTVGQDPASTTPRLTTPSTVYGAPTTTCPPGTPGATKPPPGQAQTGGVNTGGAGYPTTTAARGPASTTPTTAARTPTVSATTTPTSPPTTPAPTQPPPVSTEPPTTGAVTGNRKDPG